MAVYPSNMAPFGLKLWENAFQTIPNISFFDAEKNFVAKIFDSTGYSTGYQKTGKAMKAERKIHGKPRWRPERQEKSERGAKNRLRIHGNSKPILLLSGGRKPQWQQG